MLLLFYDEQSSDRWLPRVRFFTLMRRMRTGENVARNERRKKIPSKQQTLDVGKISSMGKISKIFDHGNHEARWNVRVFFTAETRFSTGD